VRVAVVREPREAIPLQGVDRDRVRPSRHEGRGQGRRGGGRGRRTWPTCWRWHDDASLRRLRWLYKSVAAWPKNGTFSRLILCRYPAGLCSPGLKVFPMKIRAGYEISYDCPQSTPMILTLSIHPSRIADLMTWDRMRLDPPIPANTYHDGFGNFCHVIRAPRAG
jgi:hypothetical protein